MGVKALFYMCLPSGYMITMNGKQYFAPLYKHQNSGSEASCCYGNQSGPADLHVFTFILPIQGILYTDQKLFSKQASSQRGNVLQQDEERAEGVVFRNSSGLI